MCVPPSWLVATPWLVQILLRPLVKVRGSSPWRRSSPYLLYWPWRDGRLSAPWPVECKFVNHWYFLHFSPLVRLEPGTYGSAVWCSTAWAIWHTYIHTYRHTLTKWFMMKSSKNRRNLITVWLDYKKAFDSVPHSWIIESLKLVKIPEEIIEVIKMLMCKWRTKRHLYRETDLIKTSEVEYYKGILQGDMLSLMLFILSINPLSFILHKEEGYKLGKEKEQGEHKQETEKTSTNLSPLFLWMTLNCMQWPWRWWEPYWK